MYIVGLHRQLQFALRAANIEIAGPPTFLRHVGGALQRDSLLVVGAVVNGEVARGVFKLGTVLDFEEIVAAKEFQLHATGHGSMVVPIRKLRQLDGNAFFRAEMNTKRQHLTGFGIDDVEQQLPGAFGNLGRGDNGRRDKEHRSITAYPDHVRPVRKSR